MNTKSRTRKAATIIGALFVAGVVIAIGSQVVVMSGTKASFSFVNVKSPPGGSSATTATTTSTKSTATTGTTTSTPTPESP